MACCVGCSFVNAKRLVKPPQLCDSCVSNLFWEQNCANHAKNVMFVQRHIFVFALLWTRQTEYITTAVITSNTLDTQILQLVTGAICGPERHAVRARCITSCTGRADDHYPSCLGTYHHHHLRRQNSRQTCKIYGRFVQFWNNGITFSDVTIRVFFHNNGRKQNNRQKSCN